MGKSIFREGDLSIGHDPCYPPFVMTQGSNSVLINNKGACRTIIDHFSTHSCPHHPPHVNSYVLANNSNIYCNGYQIARETDKCNCGDHCGPGSNNTSD